MWCGVFSTIHPREIFRNLWLSDCQVLCLPFEPCLKGTICFLRKISLHDQTVRYATGTGRQAKKTRQPVQGFWIFLAVEDELLSTPNTVQQNILLLHFPASQASVITESRCIFTGVKPSGQSPDTSRHIRSRQAQSRIEPWEHPCSRPIDDNVWQTHAIGRNID